MKESFKVKLQLLDQENEEKSKYGGRVRGTWDGGLCAHYPKPFLGDILCHPDLFLYDLGRFSNHFCLILTVVNATYQEFS